MSPDVGFKGQNAPNAISAGSFCGTLGSLQRSPKPLSCMRPTSKGKEGKEEEEKTGREMEGEGRGAEARERYCPFQLGSLEFL